MQKIDKKTNELREAILNSEEYKKYLIARKKLESEPQIYEAVCAIRRRNYMIQNCEDCYNEDVHDFSERELKRLFQLCSHEVAFEFLEAELAMCRIIQNINYSIIRDIDFEFEFLEQ